MGHIHSLVIMRSLDTYKIRIVENFELKKPKRKMNWLPTHLEPVPFISTCGAIIRKVISVGLKLTQIIQD